MTDKKEKEKQKPWEAEGLTYNQWYYKNHKADLDARAKARAEANPEQVKAAMHKNYLEHREARIAAAKEWKKKNPEKRREQARANYHRKKAAKDD